MSAHAIPAVSWVAAVILTRIDAGPSNGKGKAPANARNGSAQAVVEVISDSEDMGVGYPRKAEAGKGREKESTPDPIDCIESKDHEPSISTRKRTRTPTHDFETPSDDESRRRLPRDGLNTTRLRDRIARSSEPEVVDVDAISDDIESASGFDDPELVQLRNVATPNGRQEIPRGAVQDKIRIYEQDKPLPPPKPPQPDWVPTIDLSKQISRKAAMKPRTSNVCLPFPVFRNDVQLILV